MEDSQQLVGPIVLFLLMIVVGLQLTPGDFRRVLEAPRTVLAGTLGQLLVLPLVTFGLAWALSVSPAIGAGAMLLAAAPGAGMSNVTAAVGRANVALSVTLTAVTSVLSVLSLPLLAALGIRLFFADRAEVEVPVAHLARQLGMFLLFPILLGMGVRSWRPERAQAGIRWANRGAVVAILVLTAVSAMTSDGSTVPSGSELGLTVVLAALWTGSAAALGWGIGRALSLPDDDRFTFVIEFSMRNIALAMIVAMSSLGRLDLILFSGVYSLVGYPAVIGLAVWRGRAREARENAALASSPS